MLFWQGSFLPIFLTVEMEKTMEKLWNKNFSIVTIGSFISALGSSVAGVAIGILIYLETESPLLLGLFMIANIIPRFIASFLVGPYVDRHSRIKMIYTFDFFYTFAFALIGIILYSGYFNVWVFMLISGFFGIIDTTYQTAFMSLFPEVVPKGMHTKAYSISSLIWPISAALMAPVATFFIYHVDHGIPILMGFNAITFFITALMETKIKTQEELNTTEVEKHQFIHDMKEGIAYYKQEKGILGIGLLFMTFSFVYAVSDLLRMPFFEQSTIYNLDHYAYLISIGSLGRIVGGFIHYRYKLNPKHKFTIALTVYFIVELFDAFMLFTPFVVMAVMTFLVGLFSVTSFNIRMSATQTYIPSAKRGRVNSVQNVLWNIGAIVGILLFAFIAEYTSIGYEYLILSSAIVSLSAIFLFPVRWKEEFKKIYNVDV